MVIQPNREEIYHKRVGTAWGALGFDIQEWEKCLPDEEEVIKHHLDQFRTFCEQAHDRLVTEAKEFKEWLSPDDQLEYRTLIIGTLTSQWMLLRQVLSQRVAGSPYKDELKRFDADAHRYYYSLHQALQKKEGVQKKLSGEKRARRRKKLSTSSPLVYLGRLAELTFFNAKAPGLLSVPFGAMYRQDTRSLLAIPHEVGHAVFERIPGFMPELKRQVCNFLAKDTEATPQQRLLHKVIKDWLSEIVADLAGTALVGPEFGQSALWISVVPDDRVGTTDRKHPVALIRPFIHLAMLTYLFDNSPKLSTKTEYVLGIEYLETHIAEVVGDNLKRRFESIPALTIISLEEVKAELENIVNHILTQKLETLDQQSLGEVLLTCATLDSESIPKPALLPWGEIDKSEQFVLDMSELLPPDYGTPGNFRLNFCCKRGWEICC